MKSIKLMGLTALTLGLMVMAVTTHAGEGRTWDGHAQDDASHYRTMGDESPVVSNIGSRTWDGKTQDDPSHFQHKVVESRYGGDVFVKNGSTWPMGKTWDGKTQDDASHFGSQPQGAGMDMTNCMDMPCCKNMKMDKQKCETMMKAGMSKGKDGKVKCADMPCCKNMTMDMQGCEKMMSK